MTAPVNPMELDRAQFVERFGHVFEHSAWIAAAAFDAGLPADANAAEGLHRALCVVLRTAQESRKRALIDAHPDLAGRLARAGALTAESTGEQAGAGLDRLSDDEYDRFTALNAAYREKFGFPFIMAVKGCARADILAAFEARIENTPETEFATALAQIERIALLRLKDILP